MSVKLGHSLREKHRLWVFENRVLGRIFGPKREEVAEVCKMMSFVTFTLRHILLV